MRWIAVLALAFVLVGCGGPSAEQQTATIEVQTLQAEQTATAICLTEAKVYGDAIKPIAQEWDDATKLANNTGRGQLAPQIASLQQIKRDADAVAVPACTKIAHDYLIESMDATIDGFLSFMAQEKDDVVSGHFDDARTSMSAFTFELDKAITGKK